MAKKFDIDAITDPIIRQLMRQGAELKVVLKAAKGKTARDIDQIRNWDRAQNGRRPSNYRYNPDGSRIPHSDPSRRPHLPESVVDDVWKNTRRNQETNWERLGMPSSPAPGTVWVRDVDGNWQSVTRGSRGNREWDMGHLRGQEFRRTHADYLDALDDPDIDNAEALQNFLDEFRDPLRYEVQDRLRNQSHRDEA